MLNSPFLDGIVPLPAPETSRYIWATVTQVSPTRIQVDGDSAPLGITPDTLVSGLEVNHRVYCQITNRRLTILGVSGGIDIPPFPASDVDPTPDTLVRRNSAGRTKMEAGVASGDVANIDQLPNPNLLINSNFRTNQRGYASGTYCAPGTYTVDRWKANGEIVKNYVSNPSAETATTGYFAQPGTGGTAALTSAAPSTTTAYGTKVLKSTWSVASTVGGGGGFGYEIDMAAAGLAVGNVISVAIYHAKTSINQRMRMVVAFYNGGSFLSNVTGTNKDFTAGTIYGAGSSAELKMENLTIPASTTKVYVYILSTSTSAQWTIGSYLEIDGLMANLGATALPYFDGATSASTDFVYGWYGTANASLSYRMALTALTFSAFTPRGQQVTISAQGALVQVVERARISSSGPHVLSWRGTAQARVYNSGSTAPAYAASPITLTLDGTANVVVEFGPGTLHSVKLEFSPVATPYRIDPIELELFSCQYYFQPVLKALEYGPTGQAYDTTHGFGTLPLLVPMRAAPTVTRSATASHFKTYSAAGADTNLTELTFTAATTRSVRFTLTVASGLTAGQAVILQSNNAAAYIYADAEL